MPKKSLVALWFEVWQSTCPIPVTVDIPRSEPVMGIGPGVPMLREFGACTGIEHTADGRGKVSVCR